MARKKLQGFTTIRDWLSKELTKISDSDMTIRRKDNAAKKATEKAKQALWIKTAERRPVKEEDKYFTPEENQITAVTHNRYVTRLRRDLEEMGFLSFTFESDVQAIISVFGKRAGGLGKIDTSTYKKAKACIDSEIGKAEKSLKRTKKEATKKEIESYLSELKNLKPRNPCMLFLVRTRTERNNMAKRLQDRKEKYQKKPRVIEALKILEMIHALLKKDTWQELTLGLALATGRRSVEIIYFGDFKQVGEYQLSFSGQRKTKMYGNKEFSIPSLVDTDIVINAVERLRSTTRIESLISKLDAKGLHEAEYARQINGSVAATLNQLIRDTFNPEQKKKEHWILKDSRALYARISYANYVANAKKAGRVPSQDSVFFSDVLGHTDPNEQASYKQFVISDEENLNAYQLKKAKKEGALLEYADRLPLLVEVSTTEAIVSRRAFGKYHEWVIEQVKANNDFVIDTGTLRKQLGGNPKIIGEYVALMKELQLDKPNLIQLTAKKAKPKPEPITETLTKQVAITLTYYVSVDIEYQHETTDDMEERDYDQDKISELVDEAVSDKVWDLDGSDYNDLEWDFDC